MQPFFWPIGYFTEKKSVKNFSHKIRTCGAYMVKVWSYSLDQIQVSTDFHWNYWPTVNKVKKNPVENPKEMLKFLETELHVYFTSSLINEIKMIVFKVTIFTKIRLSSCGFSVRLLTTPLDQPTCKWCTLDSNFQSSSYFWGELL